MAGPTGAFAKLWAQAGGAGGKIPWLKQPLALGGVGGALGGALFNPYTAAAIGGLALGNIPAIKRPMQKMWGISDFETAYKDYQAGGGHLSYNKWAAAGKPARIPSALTTRAKGALKKAEITPGMSLEEQLQAVRDYVAAQNAIKETTGKAEEGRAVRWDTITDPDTQMVVVVGYNAAGNVVDYQSTGQFARQPETARPPTTYPQFGEDPYGGKGQYNPYTGQWEAPVGYTKPPTTYPSFGQDPYGGQGQYNPYTGQWEAPAGYISPYEQRGLDIQTQRLAWDKEQAQMLQDEQERQYRSHLAASPMSWLQYASYTGEQPVIQPWMLPLMPHQYAGTTAGEKIPGWQGQGRSMTALPGLTTPSAQYWARMGPTGQQQYMGYQQGQGGINPMETQFRLQSQAPPGGRNYGRNYGLTWGR